MGALTPRLSLYKPGGGSTGLILPDETADIDTLNANFDKIDTAIGARNVLSTTRPATPFDGQPVFERDTGNLSIWDAVNTRWQVPNPTLLVADLNALAAFTAGSFEGRRIHVDVLNADFLAVDGAWVQIDTALAADTATRDAEYAKGSANYRIAGALCDIGHRGNTTRYDGTAWGRGPVPTLYHRRTTTQSIANAASGDGNDVILANEMTNSLRDMMTYITGVYTVVKDGLYRFNWNFAWEGNATGARITRLWWKNVAADPTWSTQFIAVDSPGTSNTFQQARTWDIPLKAGNVIKFTARQNSGGALTLGSAVAAAAFPGPSDPTVAHCMVEYIGGGF
jgi:hypothetical protein